MQIKETAIFVVAKYRSDLFGISIASLVGFNFGFDTVVISVAHLPVKELWHTSLWFHGFFIMYMALWGSIVGAIFSESVHWICAVCSTLITPVFFDGTNGVFKDNPWPIFAFFAFMMILQLMWMLTKVPETKSVSLDELEKNW